MELMHANSKNLEQINAIITECRKVNPQIQFGLNSHVLCGTQYIIIGMLPEPIRNKFKAIGATFERV